MPLGARARIGRALALAGALTSTACSAWKQPAWYAPQPCERPDLNGCVIGNVTVQGAKQVKEGDIKEKIATAETSRSLGGALENVPILSIWDRITVDYERLDPFVLERDLERVERLYRARGYYEAHAKAARVRKVGKERVRVTIVVEEGEPVKVTSARIAWKDHDPPTQRVRDAMQKAMEDLPVGAPFAEEPFEGLKQKLVRAMTDRGYAYGKVEAHADVDIVAHTAKVTYTAETGPQTVFGKITIEGQGDLPTDRLMHVIDIVPGRTFSTSRLDRAQLALGELRVFGSVEAVPQLAKEGETPGREVPVVFRVTSTTLKTLKMGGGAELGARIDVHGVASWENRNFLGGLRVFTIEAKPGLVFPLSAGKLFAGDIKQNDALIPPFAEVRLRSTLTQPGFIEALTRGVVGVDANLIQAPLTPDLSRGYLEFAGKLGVERPFWDGRVRLGLYFNASVDVPLELSFKNFGLIHCGSAFPTLAIPYLQSTFALDLRRDHEGKRNALLPAHSGFYLTNDMQLAMGGAARDFRIRPEARGYIPIGKKVTLALKVGGGYLLPFGGDLTLNPVPFDHGYGFDEKVDDRGCPQLPDNHPKLASDETYRSRWIQVLQLRGFSSGGTNSNRGYAYSAVGPQEIIPGPTVQNPPILVATGGRALWEASIELRIPIYDKFGMTLFLDGSDVRQKPEDFITKGFAPHLSTGLGIRYDTPVGPLRADIGLRIPGAQVFGSGPRCAVYDTSKYPAGEQLWFGPGWAVPNVPGGCYISPDYGQAGSLGGVPLAISLAIGEAF